jgi:hypothetical protein
LTLSTAGPSARYLKEKRGLVAKGNSSARNYTQAAAAPSAATDQLYSRPTFRLAYRFSWEFVRS